VRVSGVEDDSLYRDFKLFSRHFCSDFLKGSELVGIVNIDVVGLDVVRDGIIIFRFPEFGLPSCAIEPESPLH